MSESRDDIATSLPEESARLKAIWTTVVDAIVSIDEHGIIDSANPAAERMFGYSRDELVGKNVRVLMPNPFHNEHDSYIANYLRTGQAQIIGIGREVIGKRQDGTTFPVDLAVTEVRFGRTRLFTGVLRDLTDRKRAEEELRQQRDFARSLVETAHAAVLLLDARGGILRFNPFLEQLSGRVLADVQGMNWSEVFAGPAEQQECQAIVNQTMAGNPVSGQIQALRTTTGLERRLAWSARRLDEAAGQILGILMVGTDVTELHETQQKLLQAERLAAIGQMMTGLAHESRNVLQRARACLEMLELDLLHQPDLADLAIRAQQALDELLVLFDEVRHYASPLKLEWRHVNLVHLCQTVWENLTVQGNVQAMRLHIVCDTDTPVCAGDRTRLQQVFRNIFDNSVAACHGQGEITVVIRKTILNARSCYQIICRDTGPGLSAEQIQKIFDPFFTTKTKGTGLGMAIARRIIESHGGSIAAGSSDTGGAEIAVILPSDGQSVRTP